MRKIVLFIFAMVAINATTPTYENVTRLYVATFDRTPDVAGLKYWVNDSGLELEEIARSFFDQPETKAKYYPDGTIYLGSFVDEVYVNLFDRAPDSAGRAYWIDAMHTGKDHFSTFILAVINGAQGNDAVILADKTKYAMDSIRDELGDGGGADTIPQGSGTVGILLTDKPADPSQFVSINASIESVELMGSDDNGRVTLYSGATRVVDLLRLRNESIPFTFQDNVPTGTYCKIRLTLSDLELVLADDTPNDLTDNETYHPKLPGNGKLDLVTRDCFTVGSGEVVTLQIDIDAGNSIHIVKNNNGFNFRPVVFVDVLNQNFDPKLVRLEGVIDEVDDEQNTLLLCDAVPTNYMNSKGCVEIHLGEDAAFFDNQDYFGAPRPLEDLFDKVGAEVTVVGWPRHWVEPYIDVDVPEGYYPPPGECKLWDIDLEPGQQSAPIDCDDLPVPLPENTIVVTHDGVEKDHHHPLMVLDALVVELGDFLQVEGEVATNADSTGFSMTLAAGGPVISDDTLAVMFQPGGDNFNGTRLVSKSGELLESSDIVAPLAVQVDGILQLNTNELNAALVIVDDTDMLDSEHVTGTVLSVGVNTFTISPDAESVCGIAADQLTVNLTEDAEILTVIITDEVSDIIPGGVLKVGQTIGMNGSCEPDGYETDNVVIIDDQRE